MSESLGESLAREGLLVTPRAEREEIFRRLSLKRYARLTRASVMKAGLSLDASVVIYGEVQGTPQSLQIVAHVLNVKTYSAGSDFSASGSIDELSSLQSRVAWQILHSLIPERMPPEQEYRSRHAPIRTEALENYILGLLGKTDDARIQYFNQAAKVDPHYAAPAFELGKLYFQRRQWQEATLWLGRLNRSAASIREGTFYLGIARYHLGDYTGASQSFEIVAQAVPLSEVYNNLGASQSRRNDPKAVETFRKAVEGDTGDPAYHFNLGYALMKAEQFDKAAQEFRAVLDRSPNDAEATQMLGRCLKGSGGAPPPGLERLKANYQESAYLQLKAILAPAKANP